MGIYDRSVASRSRQNEIREIGLKGSHELAVGFGERFSLSNKLTYQRYTPVGRSRVFEDIYKNRDQMLIENGLLGEGEELITTKRLIDRANSGNYPALKSDFLGRNLEGVPAEDGSSFISFDQLLEQNKQNDDLLLQLISDNPNIKIQSDDDIGSDVLMDQMDLLSQDQDFADRSTILGKVGYLTGAMVGWIRDPTHFVSSLVGITPLGRLSATANFFRVGAAESAIVGALELAEKSQEVEFRRKFGEEELTDTDALIESGVSIASAGVLGGGIGAAVGKFLRPSIPVSRRAGNNSVTETSQEILDEFRRVESVNDIVDGFKRNETTGTVTGDGTIFDPEVQQAANLLDETLQISRNSPDNISYESHMSNYAEARRNLADGENVQVGVDDIVQVRKGSNEDLLPPIGSETATPDPMIDAQNRSIRTLRDTLKKQDVFVNEADVVGEIRPISSRELIAGLDSDDAAVRATIKCLG